MKKMKRRIVGVMLIVMLVTIVISPASFSAWANEIDDVSDSNLNTIDTEAEGSEESDTADEDEAEGLEESDAADEDEAEGLEEADTVDTDENEESEEADGSASDENEGLEKTDTADASEDEKSEEAGDSYANEDEKSEEAEDNEAENDAADEDKAEKSKEKTTDVTEDKLKKASLGKKTNVKETVHYEAGDIIKFGKYEQDGNEENGKEDIEWQVLRVESDRILVVSKYALDCVPYNTEEGEVTWETCSLRNWLNDDFKNAAFSTEEQKKIPNVTAVNESNPFYKTPGGNDTQDQIFCLSLSEIESMIGYNWYDDELMYGYSQEMIVEPTSYAVGRGAYSYKITEDNYSFLKDYGFDDSIKDCRGCWWWLRSPGFDNSNACSVDSTGLVGKTHSVRTSADRVAVRPALFITISSLERDDEELEDSLTLPLEEVGDDIIDKVSDGITDEISDEITDNDNQIKDEDSSEEYDNKDTDVNSEEGNDVTDEDSSEENTAEDADVAPDEKNEITDEPGND